MCQSKRFIMLMGVGAVLCGTLVCGCQKGKVEDMPVSTGKTRPEAQVTPGKLPKPGQMEGAP